MKGSASLYLFLQGPSKPWTGYPSNTVPDTNAKETRGVGNELVLRHLLYHKKSTVIISHMYMLLWADPRIESYMSTLHGAKQLQTDQLFNEGRRTGGGGPGLRGLDRERNKVQSGWAWLLMPNLAGDTRQALQGWHSRVGSMPPQGCQAGGRGYRFCLHPLSAWKLRNERQRMSLAAWSGSHQGVEKLSFPQQVVATAACFGPADSCGP